VSDDDLQAPVEDDGEGSDFDELQVLAPQRLCGGKPADLRPTLCLLLQVDFEFLDLKAIDFHGLRALLQRYLDGELPFALSELVEALLAQVCPEGYSQAARRSRLLQGNSVGTVVKANGDVDPLGVMSLLPLDRHRDTDAMKQARRAPAALRLHAQLTPVLQVLAFMRRKCGSSEAVALLERACALPRTALLLSERMLNMPSELAAPLMGCLFEEVGDIGGDWWWKSEPAPSEALRESFRVDRYLVLTRVYRCAAAVRRLRRPSLRRIAGMMRWMRLELRQRRPPREAVPRHLG
jgi:protein BCP1